MPALVGVVVVLVAGFFLVVLRSERRHEAVQVAWARSLGTEAEFMARFPPRSPNDAALRIERLAAAIGTDLAAHGTSGRSRPQPAVAAAFRQMRGEIGRYLARCRRRSRRARESPVPELGGWLQQHDAHLAAIVAALRSGGAAPRWERDLSRFVATPLPNLTGHADLQKVLAVRALARLAAGDHEGAVAAVEASWRLGAALEDDPVLVTQGVALATLSVQLTVLRQMGDVPPVWRERLGRRDLDARFIIAVRYEGWRMSRFMDSQPERDASPAVVLGRAVSSLRRAGLDSLSDAYRVRIDRLAAAGACADVGEGSGAELSVSAPWWSGLGGAGPDLAPAVRRWRRTDLELAFTRAILEIDAERAAAGRWPDRLPESRCDDVCPGRGWTYEPLPGDRVSVSISLAPERSDALRFVLEP